MIHKSLQPRRSQLVAAMLANGKPERLAVRHNALAGGIVIESLDCLPIGGAFATYEAAHAAHSKAWLQAWKIYEAV